MSHFTVIVVSKTGTEQEIENLLAPYHEYECTGINDQYVIDVDETADALEEYESRSDHYKDQSITEYLEDYYGRSVVPFGEDPDTMGDHKYGYMLLNEDGSLNKLINRTNPNRKWDGWTIGGRWAGYFPKANPPEVALGFRLSSMNPDDASHRNWVDSIQIKDIDVDSMKATAWKEANETWDLLDAVLKGRKIPSWVEAYNNHPDDIQGARDEYNGNPLVEEIQNSNDRFKWSWEGLAETFGHSREEYIKTHTSRVLVPFAVCDEEGWHEKGRMGWWGMTSDEQDQESWNEQFWKMIGELSPDTYLTLVDCHI